MNSMTHSCCTLAMAAAATAFVHSSLAQHAGDILLTLEDSTIRTYLLPDAEPPSPDRVFASELGETTPLYTDEPGFDSLEGAFPPDSTIGFRVLAPVMLWSNGNFDTVSPSTFRIEFGPLSVDTQTTPGVVEGFSLSVNAIGEWHRHLGYTIQSPADVGVYAMELQLFSSDPSIEDSLPFWIVFNQSDDEEVHDEAIGYLRAIVTPSCPADLDDGTGTGAPDGGVTIDDLLYYLSVFNTGAIEADLDDGTDTGTPDGGVTIDDLLYFLARFNLGC